MIRHAERADLPRIKALWDICFPGEDEFAELFFNHIYQKDRVWLYEADGVIAAMLHVIPYQIAMPGAHADAHYIYGVGTDPAFRGCGFAGALLRHAIACAKEKKAAFCMLVPQNEGLFRYYERFGFEPELYLKRETVSVCREAYPAHAACTEDIAGINAVYEKKLHNTAHPIRNDEDWKILMDETCIGGGEVIVAKRDGRITAYAFAAEGVILESFAETTDDYRAVVRCAAKGKSAIEVTCPGAGFAFGSVCMIDPAFSWDEIPKYFNLMHN